MNTELESADYIDLDPEMDAFVVGNIRIHEFLVVMGATMGTLILFGITAFLPLIIRLILFLPIPFLTALFFQVDMPRKLKIKKVFGKRPAVINIGDTLEDAYDFFNSARNYVVEDNMIEVFASIVLPPRILFSEIENELLTRGLMAAIRTTVQSGGAFEYFLFHRNYVPPQVNLGKSTLLDTREVYWMQSGTARYVTEVYVKLIFPNDLARAETLSNRVKRAYFANGGKGQWIWAMAALAAQESHDALNPGALRRRYVETFREG